MSEDTGKSKTVPKLRFPGFTDDWEQRRLGEVTDIKTGSRNHQDSVKNGEFPFFVRSEKIERLNEYDFDTSAILVPGDGRIGEIFHYYEGKFALHQRVYKIDNFNGVDPQYLLSLLRRSFKRHALRLNAQGTVPSLRLPMFTNWDIVIPKLEEQQRVGQFFKQLDHHITFQQRKLDHLKERKKALLQKMFPKEGTNVPEIRFPGFTDAWEQRRLGEVIEGLYNGQTPSRFNKDNWNGSINWLSSGELNRSIVVKTVEKISSQGKSVANLKVIPKGTVVIAITGLEAAGTRGNCAKLGIDTTLNQSCMAIFPKREILDSDYLFHWYKKIGESYGIRYTQGTKQQSYNAEIIKILPITLPKIEEQQVIARFLDDVDHQITVQQRKLDHLKLREKALLQQMFV